MAAQNPVEVQAIQDRLNGDPQLQQLRAQLRPGESPVFQDPRLVDQIAERIKALGVQMPTDYGWDPESGQITKADSAWKTFWKTLPVAVGVAVGVPAAGNAILRAATQQTTPGTTNQTTPPPPNTGGSRFWENLAGVGVPAAGQIVATKMANDANNRATDTLAASNERTAKIQAEAAEKALALERDIYQQGRADLTPYRNIGTSSLGELSRRMGFGELDTTDRTPLPSAVGATNLSALPMPQGGPTAGFGGGPQGIRMYSPTGELGLVPANKVNEAIAAGGRIA